MLGWIGYGFTSLRNAIMSTATQKLRGKVAVITGGLGLATEIRRRGVRIHHRLLEDTLDAAVAQIGRNVSTVQGDVSNLDDFDRLYRTVAAEKGMVGLMGLPGHTVKGERDE
jgi:NAD(P)-dependent dehydrogenase (short-subunit alcohol dehydrogenase family)